MIMWYASVLDAHHMMYSCKRPLGAKRSSQRQRLLSCNMRSSCATLVTHLRHAGHSFNGPVLPHPRTAEWAVMVAVAQAAAVAAEVVVAVAWVMVAMGGVVAGAVGAVEAALVETAGAVRSCLVVQVERVAVEGVRVQGVLGRVGLSKPLACTSQTGLCHSQLQQHTMALQAACQK